MNLAFKVKESVIKNQPIAALQLGNRASNVLQRGKIFTISELVDNWEKIKEIKTCGLTSVREIKAAFFSWYMWQIENTPEWERFISSMKAVQL